MLLCLSLQVDKLTSLQVDELLVIKEIPCSYVTLSLFAVTLSLFAVTLSLFAVPLSLFAVDMSLRN